MPLLSWRTKRSHEESQQLQYVPYDSLKDGDQPRDLWDRAHKLLREDKSNKQLLIAYERILASELSQVASPVTSVDWGSRDRSRQVSDLIATKLKTIEDTRWRLQLGNSTVEVKAQVDKVVKTVMWAQGFVSSAISTEPHAALAWAGVSLLLPLLLNSTSQKKALVDGLEYISTLIARFTVIEKTYQQHVRTPFSLSDPIRLNDLEHSFELQVTKLYSQVLAYQARVVCQLPRNALVRYGRDLLKVDGWSTMLADIKATESDCTAISEIFDTERVDTAWKEQEMRMEELFRSQNEHYRSLQQTTNLLAVDIRHGLEEQRDWHQTEEEIKCLQTLCTSTYLDHKNRNPDRVPGTCQWFLNNAKFHKWAESETSELLWVTADPGCGKSVLSKSLVDDELQSTLTLTTAYYFFKDDSSEQMSIQNALCALLHQICSQNRAVLHKVVDAYHYNKEQLTLSFAWMWGLLRAVTQHPEAGEIVCILDALDECQDKDRKTLIDSLNDFYASPKGSEGRLKFLVTSRPYYDIEESFYQNTVRLAGEDESEAIKHEIDLVVKDRVPKIASKKKLDEKTSTALQKRLLRTENRTYLWLYLTLDGVEKGLGLATPKKMLDFVDELPRTIDQAYEAMLLRCPQPEQARKLLHIVLAAAQPLSLHEMNIAFHIEKGHRSCEEVDLYPEDTFGRYIKNLCGLLVTILDSKIFLLHQTLKEFLLPEATTTSVVKHIDSGEVWKHSMEPKESNLILASKCLYYLSFTVFHKVPDLCYKHICDQFGFYKYTTSYWIKHFRLAREAPELIEMWYYVCNEDTVRFRISHTKELDHRRFLEAVYGKHILPFPEILAVSLGHQMILRRLLEEGLKVLPEHLILAAMSQRVDTIRILLEADAQKVAIKPSLETALEMATSKLHWHVVKELSDASGRKLSRDEKLALDDKNGWVIGYWKSRRSTIICQHESCLLKHKKIDESGERVSSDRILLFNSDNTIYSN